MLRREVLLKAITVLRLSIGGAVLGVALASAIKPHWGIGNMLANLSGFDPQLSSQLFGATLGAGIAACVLKLRHFF